MSDLLIDGQARNISFVSNIIQDDLRKKRRAGACWLPPLARRFSQYMAILGIAYHLVCPKLHTVAVASGLRLSFPPNRAYGWRRDPVSQ